MSKMDISERRISQDGRFKIRLSDKSMDVRVSTLPTQYGETVVMRILDPKAAKLDVKNIGLLPEDLERLLDTIERPQGVVIVTGPTGCGKTSTLYSMLMHIKSEKINIITIEDPIEYELKDVNQVAVNEKAGLTFSYTLRSVLRQDPDVILVGEMRDPETAIIAHQASLTGHLVLSTLHTNDAVSSILRLKNMGVPPYMVASALNGIIALRLVRKICPDCKETYRPTAAELKKANVNWSTSKKLFRGAGCRRCGDTGYSGRVGIFEVLPVNNKIKALIAADVPEQELLAAVIDAGMTPLHIDGLKKVSSGITTLEELTRVIYLSKGEEEEQMEVLEELCQQCAKPRQPGWLVCPYCATKFIDEKDRIPQLPSVQSTAII
jgi:type IV pilus assembly protein PilB